jgi:hypothetical protein
MDIKEIFAQLPTDIAKKLQLKLEDAVVSTHLTPDEAQEIVEGAVSQLRIDLNLSNDEKFRMIDTLLSKVSGAVVSKIFG